MRQLDVLEANKRIKELFEEYGPYFKLPEDKESIKKAIEEEEFLEYCNFFPVDRPTNWGEFEEFLDWYYHTYTEWEVEYSKVNCVYDSCGLDIYVLSYELIHPESQENYPVFNLIYYRR